VAIDLRPFLRLHRAVMFGLLTAAAVLLVFAGRAEAAEDAVPGAPLSIEGTGRDQAIVLTWHAPADGGADVTGYLVTEPGGASCATSGALTCTVSGLTNGTPYRFTVVASNGAGTGAPSDVSPSVRPRTIPGRPATVTGSAAPGAIHVSWARPDSNGGAPITRYRAVASPGGRSCTTDGTRTCTVTGLANGTPYRFEVRAINVAGRGPWSIESASVRPRTVPGHPQAVSATPKNGKAVVSWVRPDSNGGAPITRYRVVASPGGRSCTTEGRRRCTVGGLANGTAYAFDVGAINAAGDGPWARTSRRVTPRSRPGVPRSVTASAGTGRATVSWAAPASDGGSAVNRYRATASPGGASCTTRGSGCRITGLSSTTSYSVRVAAHNSAGWGPWSDSTGGIRPRPTASYAAVSQLGVRYTWGGSNPVTGFDCSGLTSWAWAQAGALIPRTAAEQYRATRRITRAELRPGDLVFYGYGTVSHVAMYVGDGRIVQARKIGVPVEHQSVDWWASNRVGYGRVTT
jgi:cell wall-associated NlpC family hydrolase